MNKIQVATRLICFACLAVTAGCTSGKTAMQSVSDNSSVSATTASTSSMPTEAAAQSLSESLKGCLAGISNDSSDGVKMVAEQSCRENERLRQSVVGTAIAKSGGRASAGTQGDSLEGCLARIPEDATAGQRMLAEETCERDQSSHR